MTQTLLTQSAMADRPGNTDGKVVLCHVPSGNPDNPQTIAVDPEDVEEHVPGHEGDYLGECGSQPVRPDQAVTCVCDDGQEIPIGETVCYNDETGDGLEEVLAICDEFCSEEPLDFHIFIEDSPECTIPG